MAFNKLTRRSSFAVLAAPALLGHEKATAGAAPEGPSATTDWVNILDFLKQPSRLAISSRDAKIDISDALQAAVDHAFAVGAVIRFPAGSYRITKPIVLRRDKHGLSGGLQGENGNSTRIYFDSLYQDMFSIEPGISYFTVTDLEFFDVQKRSSCAFHFRDDESGRGHPSWKHSFTGVRIVDFREGARFDGGVTPPDDRHESEVMFLHCKFRNCKTSIIYNNTQAVNHQLIGTDFENDHPDDAAGKWPMIKFGRGSFVNHLGGSVIGHGPYVEYSFPLDGRFFQATSQFRSLGVRMEARGNGPFFYHHPSSDIVRSNVFRIVVEGMSVINYGATKAPVLAQFGGRTFVVFKESSANRPMTVDCVVTANLTSNSEFGSIHLDRCKAISYRRISTVAGYGSGAAPDNTFAAIPAEITHATESAPVTKPQDGYAELLGASQTVFSGGWQVTGPKTLTFSPPDTAGILNQGSRPELRVRIPAYARPFRFRVLSETLGETCVIALFAVRSGRDVQVASITIPAGQAGHFWADIRSKEPLVWRDRDEARWDGRMKMMKRGGDVRLGLLMIDYM